jgi:hypothetical protein
MRVIKFFNSTKFKQISTMAGLFWLLYVAVDIHFWLTTFFISIFSFFPFLEFILISIVFPYFYFLSLLWLLSLIKSKLINVFLILVGMFSFWELYLQSVNLFFNIYLILFFYFAYLSNKKIKNEPHQKDYILFQLIIFGVLILNVSLWALGLSGLVSSCWAWNAFVPPEFSSEIRVCDCAGFELEYACTNKNTLFYSCTAEEGHSLCYGIRFNYDKYNFEVGTDARNILEDYLDLKNE